MASYHFLRLALIFTPSFSSFARAFGARSLNPTITSDEPTAYLEILFQSRKAIVKILHKKPIVNIKVKLPIFPTKPGIEASNFEQSKFQSNSWVVCFTPLLSSPSLPFLDPPLVPAFPLRHFQWHQLHLLLELALISYLELLKLWAIKILYLLETICVRTHINKGVNLCNIDGRDTFHPTPGLLCIGQQSSKFVLVFASLEVNLLKNEA